MRKCTNSEPGTFNHECGRPARWLGVKNSTLEPGTTYRQAFCDRCKKDGAEARGVLAWTQIELYADRLDLMPKSIGNTAYSRWDNGLKNF